MTITNTYLTTPEWAMAAGGGIAYAKQDPYVDFTGNLYRSPRLIVLQNEYPRKHFGAACLTNLKIEMI